MRLLLFIAAIVGLGWYAHHIFTDGDSGLSHFVTGKVRDGVSNGMLKPRVDAVAAAARGSEHLPAPAVASPAVPRQVGPTSAETFEALKTAGLQGNQAFTPPPAPVVPPIALTCKLAHRQVPADSEISKYSSLGVTLYADPLSRTVLVRGQPDDVKACIAFLEASDEVAGSCGVRTWAVFVENSHARGWDLTAALKSTAGINEGSVSIGSGAAVLDLNVGQVSLGLDIVATDGGVRVLQRPHVSLSNGVESSIESTREIPIPSVTLTNGFSQSSVQYRKVGLQLHVTPQFLGGDRVRLQVKQDNGLIGPNVQVGGQSIPTFDTQTVSTAVELVVGQAVVLGGVASERVEITKGFLGDKEERKSGSLYIVLATYSEAPRAVPVSDLSLPDPAFPEIPVPLAGPAFPDVRGLLPEKGWQKQERDFIRSRAAK